MELRLIPAQTGNATMKMRFRLIPAQIGMMKSNIQSPMMDGDIYTITDDVIKYALTNNSI